MHLNHIEIVETVNSFMETCDFRTMPEVFARVGREVGIGMTDVADAWNDQSAHTNAWASVS